MKLKPLVLMISGFAWQSMGFADNALDAFRLGHFNKASNLFLEQNPDSGDGQFALGEIYLYGYGLPRDKTKALAAYTEAAGKNNLAAINVLARYELLVEHQQEQALQWFKKAADLGDQAAMMYTAAAYIFGLGTPTNADIAKKYYINAAKLGNPLAQMTLAEHFFDAKSGKNLTLAWIWLNKACAQNYAPAMLMKAELLYSGKHGQTNQAEAQALLQQVLAQNYLPALVTQGDWAKAANQPEAALQFYTKAVTLGYQPAELALANFYAQSNPQLAKDWLVKAARHENKSAQDLLITRYEQEQNQALAQEWRNYIKNSSKTRAMQQQKLAAYWLSGGKYQDFMHGDYVLKGIWFDWHNPEALQENHLNAAPKFLALGPKQIFQAKYTMIQPNQIAFIEYLDAILRLKGELPAPKSLMPHYGLPNQGQLSKELVNNLAHQAYLGVAEAQFVLGQCYLHGIQVKADVNTARFWFEKARAQDELRAQYELALMDLQSNDKNTQKFGLKMLKDAAFKGNPHADYTYGLLNEFGYQDLVKQNIDEAKNMFRLASVNDLGIAKFRLAEALSREPMANMAVNARQAQQLEIKRLYQDAVKLGIKEANLPLAFMMAASQDPKQRDWALKTAENYAKAGNQEAALLAGLMIDRNLANPKHSEEAMPWFEQAQAHPIGGFVWASLHPDAEQTLAYFNKAVDAKFSYALLNRAVYSKQHQQPYAEDLQQAVNMGNVLASHLFANQLMENAEDKDMAQARQIFIGLAQKGDLAAQTKLGYLCLYGLGGEKNAEIGQQWLNLAAEQHYPMAEFLLGMSAHLGYLANGVDDEAAKRWFKAASLKMPMAGVNLGFIYETVDKNYAAARTAYQQVLAKMKLGSSYNLGLIYQYGKGLPMDELKAREYYQVAVKSGSTQAMLALGNLYLYQKGVANHEQARQWYQQAASKGQSDAWYRLGMMYEAGLGGSTDFIKARDAYQKAAQAGDNRAQNALQRLGEPQANQAMKPQKVSMVKQFLAKHWTSSAAEQAKVSSPELQYLRVLDRLNQGRVSDAKQSLEHLLKEHPYFAPAKTTLMRLNQQTT